MIRRSPVLILFILACGCANVNPGPPPVDTDKLSRVIADLNLAQSLAGEIPVLVRDSMEALYYDSVLADYGYTRTEFDSLMWIVRQEPVWIDSIYARAGVIVARGMVEEGG